MNLDQYLPDIPHMTYLSAAENLEYQHYVKSEHYLEEMKQMYYKWHPEKIARKITRCIEKWDELKRKRSKKHLANIEYWLEDVEALQYTQRPIVVNLRGLFIRKIGELGGSIDKYK